MYTFFLICATVGGTLLLLQVVLSLLGIGLETFGGDVGGLGGDVGDAGGADVQIGDSDAPAHAADHYGLSLLAKWLTVQTIVAFLTFFGLGGLAAGEFGMSTGGSVLIAVASGFGAMVLLAYCFSGLRALQGDGGLRIDEAVGSKGTVYLTIPGHNGGVGKVTLSIQGRTEELSARTPGPELRTGEAVIVAAVGTDRTLEVVSVAAYTEKPEPIYE